MSIVFPGPELGGRYSAAASYAIVASAGATLSGNTIVLGSVALYRLNSVPPITKSMTAFVSGSTDINDIKNYAKTAMDSVMLLQSDLTAKISGNTRGNFSRIGQDSVDNNGPGLYLSTVTQPIQPIQPLPPLPPIPPIPPIPITDATMIVSGNIVLPGSAGQQYYFISTGSITFNNTTKIYLGNINPWDVFWVAGTTITDIGGSLLNGMMVSVGNTQLGTATKVVKGALFSTAGSVYVGVSSRVTLPTYPGYGSPPVCYVMGTKILTKDGYVKIEDLNAQHDIIFKGKINNRTDFEPSSYLQSRKLRWLSRFIVDNPDLSSYPIRITAGSLGDGPFEDLLVSPNHGIIINDKSVTARDLVNGTTIYQNTSFTSITYYHLELDVHCGIMANGVLAESYLPDGNREIFENHSMHDKPFRTMASISRAESTSPTIITRLR